MKNFIKISSISFIFEIGAIKPHIFFIIKKIRFVKIFTEKLKIEKMYDMSDNEITKFQKFLGRIDLDIVSADARLKSLHEKRQAYDEVEEWIMLKTSTKETKFEQLTELGQDVYVNAEYNLSDKLNLEIGLG